MTVYLTHSGDTVEVLARAEGPGMLGDLAEVLKPGDSFMGRPYAYWFALPDGEHLID